MNRSRWIDMAKGIGIILVILGHISFLPQWLNVWLCSFHMPLFFFLSGITYNPDKFKEFGTFLKTKVKQLVIPYFIFAVIMLLWKIARQSLNLVLGGGFDKEYILKQFAGIFLQIRTTDYGVGVWFVPCIFIAFILLFFIIKLSKGKKLSMLLISLCSLIAGYLYCTFIDIKLPWGIDAAFVAVFFMALGCMFRQSGYIEKLKNIGKGKFFAMFLVFLALNIIFAKLNFNVAEGTMGMWSNRYGNLFYFVFEALFGIALTASFTQLILANCIETIGRKSIFFYGVHIIILEMSAYITRYVTALSNDVVAFAGSIVLMLITVVVLKILYPVYKWIYDYILSLFFREENK